MRRGQGLDHPENTNWTGNGKNYFLGIGIDRYLHWDQLNNAVKDVNDFIKVLTSQYQFEPDEVHTLFDTDATEGKIYHKIRELKRTIRPGDNLVVYYSGHGHYDEEFEEGYWIPVDADKTSEDRFISNANIIKRINAIDTQHTLMIVDSCFSGTLVVKKRSGLTDERFKSRRILASGRQETVADGLPGQNSPFAAGILTYLKKNTEKAINTTTLVQYVKDFVETKARQTPVEGRIQNSADEGGEFVFHLKMDERGLWESVQSKDSAEAYANYLDYYPQGLYANQAEKRILDLKEDDIWHSAKIKDSELAYENYLKKYSPKGKYVKEANTRLGQLQAAQQERRQTLDEMAKKEDERDRIRQSYDSLIAEAESLFTGKQLSQARERYREALRYYMNGFVPKTDYIEEQINFCSNGIKFLEHYENGRRAMDNYNYRLALQYFGEALKVDDNPKVEDLISYCRLKLKEKTAADAPMENKHIEVNKTVHVQEDTTQKIYQPPLKKKRSPLKFALIFGGVFIALIVVAMIAAESDNYEPDYTEETYPVYEEGEEQTSGTETEFIDDTPVSPPPAPAADYASLIIGSWVMTDFYSDDPNADMWLQSMKGLQATYTFYTNGQMNMFTSLTNSNYYYYLNGEQLTIQGAVPNAHIDELSRQDLVLTLYENQNGYSFSVTFEFRKMD
ncbi:caspase family protein [Flavilitoribacter nigricans]|uniref:Peptidase C14 caspase domain-containing protein n=1 Tax=Flavilitoribacter nigricans (strain ATCC 23147 / DSM 23189 / NBRC 102662 / NCIMB 1420 / SS-2) TaxID=1122177 RepID=A0A2D0N7K9_FLAN2|nr:caspase family protein [Flavilitoribacter nigricans]PHN04501.1 hypothetical protein CRP01_21075 [Flavilitoribacter nigricans DSM 23189 = NBRC 102662]